MAEVTESELLVQARLGDPGAFDELVTLYLPRIYRLCFSLTQQQQDAEDCTQDCFLKAYRSIHTFHGQSAFYTWLYRIARNVCHDFYRARSGKETVSLDQTFGEDEQPLPVRDEGLLPDDLAISHELGDQLSSLINALPEPMREVLLLRDLEGYSYDEIARIVNVSEGTVKSRLFRARAQVMTSFSREQNDGLSRPTKRSMNQKGVAQ